MLSNIRVLDFTRLLPGGYATQILADLGAEVIKIEEPGVGDYARVGSNKEVCVDGNSCLFHCINRGKKSIVLDLKDKKNHEILTKLIKSADIVIESFRPNVLKKLKFSPSQMLEINESLIVCSISGFGQNGPDYLKAGHDINYISRAGLMGLVSNPSTLPSIQIADLCGGAYPAVIQILAALYARKANGNKGAIIDVSMTDNSYALTVYPQTLYNKTKEPINDGNFILNGKYVFYNIYKCKDGYISVGCVEPKFWYSFCKAINKPNLQNKQFALTNSKEGQQIINEINDVLNTKTQNEWKFIFDKYDCCAEIISSPQNVTQNDPQLKYRDLDINVEIKSKDGQKTEFLTIPKSCLNMNNGIQFQNKCGPQLGQHNNEILSKL